MPPQIDLRSVNQNRLQVSPALQLDGETCHVVRPISCGARLRCRQVAHLSAIEICNRNLKHPVKRHGTEAPCQALRLDWRAVEYRHEHGNAHGDGGTAGRVLFISRDLRRCSRRRSTSAIVLSAWSSSSLCDARGRKMSPPQTSATPMTISPMPRVVICYAKTYSNPVLYRRHLAARTALLSCRPSLQSFGRDRRRGWPDDLRLSILSPALSAEPAASVE